MHSVLRASEKPTTKRFRWIGLRDGLRRWRWGSSPNGRISGRHGWMIEAAKTRRAPQTPTLASTTMERSEIKGLIERSVSGKGASRLPRLLGKRAGWRGPGNFNARHTLSGGRGNEFVLANSGMPAPFGAPHCATATSGAEGRDMAAFASRSGKIGRRLSPLRAGGEAGTDRVSGSIYRLLRFA